MKRIHLSSGWGIVILGLGLLTAFVLGDVIPGMVLAGWIIAFTGMIALTHGDRGEPDSDPFA